MGEEERIHILELAYDLVNSEAPKLTVGEIEKWAKLFDKAYKAIMTTALEK